MESKRCSKCGEEKPLVGFSRCRSRGHDGWQAWCKACKAADGKRYQKANREKLAAAERRYRKANPEAAAAKAKRHYESHREHYQAMSRARYEADRERQAELALKWRAAHPDEARASDKARSARYRAAKRAAPTERFTHAEIFVRDGGVCGICSGSVDPEDWHLDHVHPISRGGSHTCDNVQVTHPRCNQRKGASMPNLNAPKNAE